MYLNKRLKLHVTSIVSDNLFVSKICNESFLKFEIYKFNACPEIRVGISTQDGRMHYLSLILYLNLSFLSFLFLPLFGRRPDID